MPFDCIAVAPHFAPISPGSHPLLPQTPFMMVCLYESLYRNGMMGGGRLKTQLKALMPKMKELKDKYHVESDYKRLPLYARINTLKTPDPMELIQSLTKQFPESKFTGDVTVNYLLKFPASTNFSKCKEYLTGQIILQDKASCFPAVALDPPENGVILDACSAPGNKTLHLSAMVDNTGKIIAVEKDKRRFYKLSENLKKHGATNVFPKNEDFFEIDPTSEDYKDVTHILLDPSCSGSGMVTQRITQNKIDKSRISSLSDLQKRLLTHAMTFPNAAKIVYSTCSIHQEENEIVVKSVLENNKDWALIRSLPDWERRGLTVLEGGEVFEIGDRCVRCTVDDDTNGFFLATFVRIVKEDTEFVPNMKFERMFAVNNINKRFKIKGFYKYPYKFIKI